MTIRRVLGWLIKCVRYVLLPFPLSFALWIVAVNEIDKLLPGTRIPDPRAEAIGMGILVVMVGALQLTWGIASMLVLECCHSGARGYRIVGFFSGLGLSLFSFLKLRAPQFGFEWGWAFVFLLLGVLIIGSYLLASFIHRNFEQRT